MPLVATKDEQEQFDYGCGEAIEQGGRKREMKGGVNLGISRF